jgi:predicted nucleic acid-binding protein
MIELMTPLELLPVDARDVAGAVATMRDFSDQDLTLVDAVGLRVMKERGTRSCWSTDYHLGLTGVHLVIHEH